MMTATLSKGNLPAELTSFVGRRAELADVRRQLGNFRLVTLTGMGGVGKTRLALRTGSQSDRAFADGVWLVELAALRDPAQLSQQIASALGVRDLDDTDPMNRLMEFLSGRRALLILDNCEHLLSTCADVVERILRSASDVTVLATSRQPLGVQGELVLAVSPLPVPTEERHLTSVDAVSQFDSTTLFVERARAVLPGFQLTPENAPDVVRLLNRIDGIPLAVELAAARLRVLGPRQIVDRLDDGYQLLQSVSRTALPHRRSLRALIDWSFDLCTENEQKLWARLSVFPKDFDLDAAEQICGTEAEPSGRVIESLAGLVDKSVLIADSTSGDVRYRLPETLREYGAECLAEMAEAESIRLRHCEYYGNLAKSAWLNWFGPDQLFWTNWMGREAVNLRVALETGLSNPTAHAPGLSVVPALAIHWLVSGSLNEGRTLTERALELEAEPTRGRALLLALLAWLAGNQGDLNRAREVALEAKMLAARTGEIRTFGHSNLLLGLERIAHSDLDAAQACFEAALTASERQGQIATAALRGLAVVAGAHGDRDLQAAHLASGVAISDASQESWERAATLWAWARIEWDSGHLDRADDMARDALRLRAQFYDRIGLAQSFELLAWCAARKNDFGRAARLLAAGDVLWRDLGGSLYPDLVPIHDECAAQTLHALGERAIATIDAEVETTTLESLVGFAMGEEGKTSARVRAAATQLTPRELEIAELVALGLSNREIASKMVIAQRTAEGHVEHILVKLGFQSRTQIAAWVVANRASGPSD
jgi:predicted ATPase/DNA-binding CsgD family transcriptional regulator